MSKPKSVEACMPTKEREKGSHTPGPWNIDEGGSIQGMIEGVKIQLALISPTRFSGDDKDYHIGQTLRQQCAGNARLIAAAPELLEFIKNARKWALSDKPEEAVAELRGDFCKNLLAAASRGA